MLLIFWVRFLNTWIVSKSKAPANKNPWFARFLSHRRVGRAAFLKIIDGSNFASKRWRVDTIFMRFRATLASLLTVILLSFSSDASACEIRCDRASLGVSCHAGMKHSPQQRSTSMSSMPEMDASPAGEEADPGPAIASAVAQSCSHHVCAPQPVLLNAQTRAFTNTDLSHQVSLLFALPQEYVAPSGILPVRGPPPIHRASPVSLRTTLRI